MGDSSQALTAPGNGSKPRTARTNGKKEKDRAEISDRYVKGWTLAQIGEELKLSIATVHRDLKVIRTQWLERSVENFDQAKARELARIDLIEREAWEAWRDSRSERQITTTKRVTALDEPAKGPSGQPPPRSGIVGARNEAQVRREKREGNPQYLQTIQWCVEQRCKIFGLYAPTQFSLVELDNLIENELGRLAGRSSASPALNINARTLPEEEENSDARQAQTEDH